MCAEKEPNYLRAINVATLQRDHQTTAESTLLYNYLVILSSIRAKLFLLLLKKKQLQSAMNFKEIAINNIDGKLLA